MRQSEYQLCNLGCVSCKGIMSSRNLQSGAGMLWLKHITCGSYFTGSSGFLIFSPWVISLRRNEKDEFRMRPKIHVAWYMVVFAILFFTYYLCLSGPLFRSFKYMRIKGGLVFFWWLVTGQLRWCYILFTIVASMDATADFIIALVTRTEWSG